MKMNVNVKGLDKVMRDFTSMSLKSQGDADKVTETYVRKMANESAKMAPVETGDLRASIASSPRRLKLGTWEYGSELPYARRQEYEHRSKKGFIRKSVYKNRNDYRNAIRKELSKWR